MKKFVCILFFWFCFPKAGHCLEEKIEKYDAQSYSVIVDTKSLLYLEKCSRGKLQQFEWKVWEENWSVRARLQPIATILIKRELEDPFMSDAEAFIRKAIGSSLKVGGHILCMVKLERDPKTLMVKSVSFRAYRQIFVSGNQSWESYLNELVVKELPLTLEDFKSIPKSK